MVAIHTPQPPQKSYNQDHARDYEEQLYTQKKNTHKKVNMFVENVRINAYNEIVYVGLVLTFTFQCVDKCLNMLKTLLCM